MTETQNFFTLEVMHGGVFQNTSFGPMEKSAVAFNFIELL